MRYLIIVLLLLSFTTLGYSKKGDIEFSDCVYDYNNLTFTGEDGKTAEIFFDHSLRYEGELPVEESAKIFFDALGGIKEREGSIYIILFVSLLSPHWMVVNSEYSATGSIEICHSIEEVNEKITAQNPHAVYSYSLDRKELRELEIDFFRVIKKKKQR